MREYYGNQIGYYCDDSNHKVFSWKMDGFKFKLKNNTEYVLKVGIRQANGKWSNDLPCAMIENVNKTQKEKMD